MNNVINNLKYLVKPNNDYYNDIDHIIQPNHPVCKLQCNSSNNKNSHKKF